jgi:Trk-type K+ transport system membrane component
LAYDVWFQLLAWFLICIIERGKLTLPQPGFSIFNIFFEVTSAYGTVGLSLGVPHDQNSLSGAFHTLSKVILLFVMIRGRGIIQRASGWKGKKRNWKMISKDVER